MWLQIHKKQFVYKMKSISHKSETKFLFLHDYIHLSKHTDF